MRALALALFLLGAPGCKLGLDLAACASSALADLLRPRVEEALGTPRWEAELERLDRGARPGVLDCAVRAALGAFLLEKPAANLPLALRVAWELERQEKIARARRWLGRRG